MQLHYTTLRDFECSELATAFEHDMQRRVTQQHFLPLTRIGGHDRRQINQNTPFDVLFSRAEQRSPLRITFTPGAGLLNKTGLTVNSHRLIVGVKRACRVNQHPAVCLVENHRIIRGHKHTILDA